MRNDNSYRSDAENLLGDVGESLRRFDDSKELLQKVLDTIPQTVFWKDINLNYLGCNQLFAANAGLDKPADIIGLSDFDLPWDPEETEFYRACDRRIMASGKGETGIIESQINADGELTWLDTNKVPLHNDDGDVIGILGTYHDITRLKQAEEVLQRNNEELERRVAERTRELKFVADHDGLTGLANRIHFVHQINEILQSDTIEKIALMFIDLDNFKGINDEDGHDAGDQLLVQMAAVLNGVEGTRNVAGRFGGDEFLLLLRDVENREQAERVCEEIQYRLNNSLKINGSKVPFSASIGVVFCDTTEYSDCYDVLNDADLAMYSAKNAGKNNYSFFQLSMRKCADDQFDMERGILAGIENGEFQLYYQPIIDLDGDRICGFEALARWIHPERGLIPPNSFIPVAESSGVIVQLGQEIIESACRQLAQWQREYPQFKENLKVNINLSPRQLFEPGFVDNLRATVTKYGVAPESLCLEITETLLLADSEMAIRLVREIREEGFMLSLDDFGTGYSSLNYLDELPVDSLKIDRSFVNKLGLDSGNHAVVRMIIALAEALDVKVIAEGVETSAQIKTLKSMQCNFIQGYYFARPMPVVEATEYLIRSSNGVTPDPPGVDSLATRSA